MAKRLTVHLRDAVTDSVIEVDGKELETEAVQVTYSDSSFCTLSVVLTPEVCKVVDERSGIGG